MKKYSLLFFLALGVLFANAQDDINEAHYTNYRSWAVDGSLGLLYTGGDLSSFTENGFDAKIGFSLGVTKYISSVWGFNVQTTFGNYSGTNDGESFSFDGGYFDFAVRGVANLNNLAIWGRSRTKKWAFPLRFGGGLALVNPTLYDANDNALFTFGEGQTFDRSILFFASIGAGVKYQLNNSWDLDFGLDIKAFIEDKPDGLETGNTNDFVGYPHVGVTYNFAGKGGSKKDKTAAIYASPLEDIYGQMSELKSNFDKLTSDDDKDGVNNFFDQDNATPEGVVVDGSGKATDVDQDGIPDYIDDDPFTDKGAKVDAAGRAIDSDGDGVPDHRDAENNTEKGQLVNFKGESIKMPSSAGTGGYMPSVYFAFNSASVTAANHQRLAAIARVMNGNPDLKVKVTGYTDNRGSEEYNKNLGMRRANAVVKQLTQVYGIAESRLTAESGGEGAPLADGRYDINRRVDITPN